MAENSQSRMARRKQKKSKKKPLWRRIVRIIGIVILALVIGVGALFTYYAATAPSLDAAKLQDPFSSKIYDKDGDLFADLGEKQRTKVNYDELPQVLIDAVIATEDSRFFEHHGIDPKRIGGAIVANVTHGFGSQGASTITQQLVEKAFLPPDKKIKLKVQEMWLALQLEREYSKKEILEMYLNKIYYGSGAYGVAKAAQIYFDKTDLSELTLPEAAILAGLPQRPSAYNPYENPDLMKERMSTVLKLMVMHGKISQKEADEALEVDIPSLLTKSTPEPTPYDAFVQKVRKEVEQKLDADIYTDGLKVYTTIDTDMQDHVEFLMSDEDDNPIPYPDKVEDPKTKEMVDMQAGMVVLDTKNGAIRAIGGAHGGIKNDSYNYAIQVERQAGSTMKPIAAYGPAIEHEKWSTYHQINDDKPYEIKGTDKKVGNWNGQYQGWMSIRKALAESLNVPAMKTNKEIGQGKAQEFAEGLGINFGDKNMIPTDAIGGGSLLVNPLEMAGAYQAFANEGISNDPYSVTKVEFPDGRTKDLKPKPEAVMSDYTAYMITDMLKTAITSGTGKLADIPGLPVAGKTGTTNRPGVEGSPDSWFSGYTTNYTISIWTGYNNNDIGLPNTKIPHALFKNTMSYISDGKETADFKKPSSVVEVGVEKGTNPARLPSDYTPDSNIVTELFIKGNEPSKTSEKFDKLDPVSKLTADYDKDDDKINVKWDYDDDADVSFQVSASVDGGSMQELSTTDDTSMEIASVDPGSEYTIQVVAVSNDDNSTSEAKSTKVKVPREGDDDDDDDEDEDEDDQADMEAVSGLGATYKDGTIDVSWKYNGPAATFEVTVAPDGGSPQQQTVNSNGIKIDNAQPGTNYTISVTPVGKNGDTEGVRGESQSTSVSVPPEADETNGDNAGDDQSDNGGDDQEGDSENEEDHSGDNDGGHGDEDEGEQSPAVEDED